MPTPRIGIFTFYTGNYGAALQAFATQYYLRTRLGLDAAVVRTRPGVPGETRLTRLLLRGGLFRSPIAKLRRRLRRTEPQPGASFQARLAERARKFAEFEETQLALDDNPNRLYREYYRSPPDYDIYLSGSDQVWNPTGFGRCNPVYYLDFVPEGRKRVSYASSFAISEIPARYRREMKRFLARFDSISVRETGGADIVEELTGIRPPVVVDPTFLLTGEEWRRLIGTGSPAPRDPYILFYRLGTQPGYRQFRDHVLTQTRLHSLTIPTREQDAPCGEGVCDAGPFDFVRLIAQAALVVTDSFHAAALSINLGTPFYALLRDDPAKKGNMNSRVHSLLKRLDLTGRLIDPNTPFPQTLTLTPPDAGGFLTPWRTESAAWLKTSLS